jgi:hypothetical protein
MPRSRRAHHKNFDETLGAQGSVNLPVTERRVVSHHV